MVKVKKWILFYSASVLPVVPMLYLFNQNAKYLSFAQVFIAILLLVALTSAAFAAFKAVFRSEMTAFFACLIMNIVLFSYNSMYYNYLYTSRYAHAGLLLIPLLSFILAYIFNRLTKGRTPEHLPKVIAFIVSIMLVINIFSAVTNVFDSNRITAARDYKLDFITDDTLPAPNVYWILCDGLLGFDAMAKYFNEPQVEVKKNLFERGFAINSGAMLESGHSTRIAIPALMCPAYTDKYLGSIITDHQKAMQLNYSSDAEMFYARYYNETINAFDARGYTTVSMSLDEDVFFPTTDYFYYVAAHYTTDKEYADLPYYVKTTKEDSAYLESRFFAMHLGDVLLGGIPDIVYNFFNKSKVERHQLTADRNAMKDLLPPDVNAQKYEVLISSIYDSLYSKEINQPRFTLLHAFMAHYPLCFDENGNFVNNINNMNAYPGHHAFALKNLLIMIDLILGADPDAVIVLQADHGLHGQTQENIVKAFGNPDAALDIWNNVFSAIRVPGKFKNGSEYVALDTPLNMSRYLINSFVGQNYEYATAD